MTLYKSKIIYLILGLITFFTIFFIAPQSVDAACVINSGNNTRFRDSNGQNIFNSTNFWTDWDNQPYLYLDVDTDNCSQGELVKITIFSLDSYGRITFSNIQDFSITISQNSTIDSQGRFTFPIKVGQDLCTHWNNNDCLVFAVIYNQQGQIIRIVGEILGRLSSSQAVTFINERLGNTNIQNSLLSGSFPNQAPIVSQNNGNTCSGNTTSGFFFQTRFESSGMGCSNVSMAGYGSVGFDQKIRDYYNNYVGGSQFQMYAASTGNNNLEFRIAVPGAAFNCPGASSCTDDSPNTSIVQGNGSIIPFGTNYSQDSGIVNVNPLPSNYQTEYIPLAPLPFEGLTGGATPSLGEYLASIFRMAIVVIVILAVIMIVFHGIAYATTGAINKKDDHREGVKNAILGLVLALGSWLLLNTINPRLASQLSIGIPMAHLDGPDPAWNNGNAAAGTVISSKALLGGQPIVQGMPWPDDSMQRSQLASAGISVVSSGNSNCTPTAGTPNCTSVYFDGPAAGLISQIISFKGQCNCEIVITGGSEAWLHSSHGPNKKVVDFRATTSLNEYLNGLPGGPVAGNSFPSGKSIFISGVGKFYAEPSGATGNTTAKHWHVTLE